MGKTIVITGASDGIGASGARLLSEAGHDVVVVGRSPEKTRAVAEALGARSLTADFARLEQVRKLAAALLDEVARIDVLVNNAGGIFGREPRTEDGHELTLQVNHLAPFLLTNLLMERLIASRASVIQTSSIGSRLFGHLDLGDLDNDRAYSADKAYGDSKLANILFTRELHARYADQGIAAAAFHPGVIATSFASDTTSRMRFLYRSPLARLMGGADAGGRRLARLAAGTPGTDWESGAYYERNRIARRVNPQVHDAELARALWERSAELVGLA